MLATNDEALSYFSEDTAMRGRLRFGAADELVLVLPSGAALPEQQALLRTFSALVVPSLQMVLSRRR